MMFTKLFRRLGTAIIVLFVSTALVAAEDFESIKLPAPKMTGGRPLMEVLKDRKTTRSFAKTKLSEQTLSNLLWAACGINRPERNLRTAPSAMNEQAIDIYVALEKGLYLYEPKSHELKPILAKDIRGATGSQSFVKDVPLDLVYVADFGRMRYPNDDMKVFYSAADTGHISQNVYLFCASEGLGAVIRGLVNKPELAKEMNLRPDQKIILCQSIGYPKDATQK
jgi:SagB-type dehydrogenase family enzyme